MTWDEDHDAMDRAVARELLACIRRAQSLRAKIPWVITRGWDLALYEDQLSRSIAYAESRSRPAAPSASPEHGLGSGAP